jgi:hypothetical protein
LLWDALGNFVSLFYILALGYELGAYWQTVSGVLSIVGYILFALVSIAIILILSGGFRRFWKREKNS